MQEKQRKTEEQSNRSETRFRSVTSKVVGMYRLLTEQFVEKHTDVFRKAIKAQEDSEDFNELKGYIINEVHKHITSPEQVKRIMKDAHKERGSLTEILFPGNNKFPKQTILIRFGSAIESAIHNYLSTRNQDIKPTVKPIIQDFLEKNVQLDVAVEKDKTYFISELKYNLNLDTEKISKVVEKLDLLGITLKKFYKHAGIDTNVTLVSLRYPYAEDIINLKPELSSIKEQYILGYVEFFNLFGINVKPSEWEKLHAELGEEILNTYNKAYNDMSGGRK